MAHCMYCESDGGEFGLLEVWDYDWDSDDDLALSVQRVVGHHCADVGECARRIVDQGTSIEGLRMVAADYENLGELATQARQMLREWSELAQAEAHTADLVARENGYGVIGNY